MTDEPNERYRPKKQGVVNNSGDYCFKVTFDKNDWHALDVICRKLDLSRSAIVRRVIQHALCNPHIFDQIKG